MLEKVILYSFYILFFLTPLFWTSLNYELFEFNKMILVYFLTTLATGAWILKMLSLKTLLIKRTPLDIPILLFLAGQILSTIFSIDPHSSIFGYYSRSNGGLLSTICYTLLYFLLISNFGRDQVLKLLKVALLGGVVVALWAVPEHFGVSPSCVILRGDFGADCWIQDVQARVFATLGQPNWLAAYMEMLIFPALYFFLTAKSRFQSTIYYLLSTIYYLAFTFTYSRGATLGLITGFFTFIVFYILAFHPKGGSVGLVNNKSILIVLTTFLAINIFFGSALTRFQLSQLISNASKESKPTLEVKSSLTQLENGGTESGKIRLIVWKGALDIFKHYPLFGSGVETFAYSYYQFRPQAHNLVSEWDFLYNKAHNEFLNYLATTGIVGFGTYMLIIGTFVIWSLKYVVIARNKGGPPKGDKQSLLILTILASYLAYLIQNFFGFSVVTIALFFYLFPAVAFVATDSVKPFTFHYSLFSNLFRHRLFNTIVKLFTTAVTIYLLTSILKLWYADTLFAKGERNSENNHPGLAYNYLTQAVIFNSLEPYYNSELGYAAAASSLALQDSDATLSGQLKQQAVLQTEKSLETSPKNVSFYRTAIRTYYLLAASDDSYNQKTLTTIDKTITLAPTDPKLYYNKAIILGQIAKNQEAVETLQKAIALKSNYRDAYFAISLFYFDLKKEKEAVDNMNKVLQLIPNDPDALKQLNEWKKK